MRLPGIRTRRRTGSIHAKVLGWQLGALLMLGCVSVFSAYTLAVKSFAELRDVELVQIAEAVARHGIASNNDNDNGSDDDEPPGDFLSQVWEADKRLSYASHDPPVAYPKHPGHLDFSYGSQHWHGYVIKHRGQTILVAREAGARGALLSQVSMPLLALLTLLTLILMGILAMSMRRALAPLEGLRHALEKRDPASLDHIDLPDAPAELVPLVDTLNALLDRVGRMIDGQRRFTADAAHELRTPVTAVGLFAQLAHKAVAAGQTGAIPGYISSIETSCRRAQEMIEQLLTLARLDPENPPQKVPIALHELVRNAVAESSALADVLGIDLGLVACPAASVVADPVELRILLDNLIGNALRYTPRGGRVDVGLEEAGNRQENGWRLTIDDTGPGLPADELERVFERFHRAANQDMPGSGLGLAIVQRIAQRYGLAVHLENRPGGGLRAVVVWPPESAAPG